MTLSLFACHLVVRSPRCVYTCCVLAAIWGTTLLSVIPSIAEEPPRVRGVVSFSGPIPKSTVADDAGQKRELFEVHPKTRGLKSAVVFWIDAPAESVTADTKGLPMVVVDQKEFTFSPHVVSVRSGQLLKFTNSDSANHNVRATAFEPANQINTFTTAGNEYTHQFVAEKKHRPIRLGCDIHPWMSGWIYVFDHPHHAVTDEAGKFELPHLPVGRQRLAIRQPDGNLRREITIDVIEGKTATLDVGFRDTDIVR